MKNIVCWRPEQVGRVINIDADHVADPVFWAIDTETPLHTRAGEGGSVRQQCTAEVVDAMLDPSLNHFQLAVLGPAGAGKSHLIHRMRQQIERRPGLEVLAIRRLETNLRAVLEKLIARLPTEDRPRYLEELRRTGPALSTPAVQKSTLLDSLAQAIEEDAARAESGIDQELEEALLASLPSLFRDPYLRDAKFLRDEEVVPELVDRLFSSREGKRIDEEILFEGANLPLSGIDVRSCSKPAREAVDIFTFDADRTVPAVLRVINRNLGPAISRALNFSGDQLGDLLGRIREHLKEEGKELVILFEEFARLQGYDLAMLAALIVQGDERLCRVRWALACTSGRFLALPDTVRSRMDLVVDMRAAPTRPDLGLFAGRYLNAVRVGATALAEAYDSAAPKLPNACTDCHHRSECFEAFGAVGPDDAQVGLYPFTPSALATLARRSGAEDGETFNPREFQKKVLKPVLIDEARDLAADNFPTTRFLTQMGGPEIATVDRGRLQERAGAKFERYLAFFQLWNEGRLSGASPDVLRAFGLEPLAGLADGLDRGPPAEAKSPERSAGPARPEPPRTTPRDADAAQLERWIDGGALDQNLAQRLRQVLFPLIERAIDWDALGLHQATFSGATTGARPFRNQSIQFLRQVTRGGVAPPVVLELPLKRDAASFSRTALALESLLKYERARDWRQANGLDGLAAISELATACAAEAARQLQILRGDAAWDPLAGAAELLVIGAALGGVLAPTQTTDESLLEAMFRPMPPECPFANGRLRALYDRLLRRRPAMQELVRAHVSLSKGGRLGRTIDPRPLRAAARSLRRNKWTPAREPQLRPALYTEVGTLYEQVKGELQPALAAEREGRRGWLVAVDEAFAGSGKQAVLTAVREATEAATAFGVPVSTRTLDDARHAFSSVQFDAAVRAVRVIDAADPPQSELLHYAKGRVDAVDAATRLIKAWGEFLAAAEADVARKREKAGLDELSQNARRVSVALEGLCAELRDLENAP